MIFFQNIGTLFTYLNCKTLVFNFHYLPFREALHLPFFLSRGTRLRHMRGSLRITGPLKPGMIRIGDEEVGFYNKRHNRATWENQGEVEFQGKAKIKYGASIIVAEGACLKLGPGFRIASGSRIICYKNIELGQNCRISWDTQLIDTDFHRVFDDTGKHINPDQEIRIGNDCWIGNHCMIQKGTELENMVVVAAYSLVNSRIPESGVLLAGIPAMIKKRDVYWGK